ncbi:MAG: trypsin-like peptidase domain-containing protein, partial [Acidimicrobiia bacterium]
LHVALPPGPVRQADRVAGAGLGVLGVLASVWLLLPIMADVEGTMARQTRSSTIARFVHDRFPDPPDTLAALRRLVGGDQFPQVFDALQRTPSVSAPPAASGLPSAVAQATAASVVKVEGVACRRIQDGSGFVVAEDLVVTNAHVVAGEPETDLQRPDGSQVTGRVVAFDPRRDLALVHAPGLGLAPLPLGDTDVGGRGGVFGHPGGGPLEISPFEVARETDAVGRDIYDGARTERRVLVLSSELRPGDSGAALVDPTGTVVGVAFAIAPDRPGVAYALDVTELHAVLEGPHAAPVDTGPCLT